MLTEKDKELITAATAAIKTRYRNDWQEVGAAMRTRDGRIVTGVNIDAYIGRIAVCAEAIAIGRAITETGDHGIETIVAVLHVCSRRRNCQRMREPNCSTLRDAVTSQP